MLLGMLSMCSCRVGCRLLGSLGMCARCTGSRVTASILTLAGRGPGGGTIRTDQLPVSHAGTSRVACSCRRSRSRPGSRVPGSTVQRDPSGARQTDDLAAGSVEQAAELGLPDVGETLAPLLPVARSTTIESSAALSPQHA